MDDTTDPRLATEVERLGDAVTKLADNVAGGNTDRIFAAVSHAANSAALTGQQHRTPDNLLPPIEEQHAAILGQPGAKKFGLTPDVLAAMAPAAVADLYSQLAPKPAKPPRKQNPDNNPPDTFGFADPKDRIEHGPTYPFASGGGSGGKSGGGPGGGKPPADNGQPPPGQTDPTRILESIDRAVWRLVAKAGREGTNAKPEAKAKDGQPEQPSIFQPIKDAISRTRLGQIYQRFHQRAAPHVRNLADRARGGRKASPPKTASRKPPPKPGGGPPLPVATPVAAEAGAAEGGAAVAGGGAAAAGAAVPVVGIVIAATFALVELTKAGFNLAHQQEDHARKLAEFSPSQAANVTELDVGRIQRSVELGEGTADSAHELTQAIDRFEKAILPIEKAVTNIANVVGAEFMETLANIAEALAPIAQQIEEVLKKAGLWKAKESNTVFFGKWAGDVAKAQDAKDAAAKAEIERLRRAAAGF